MPNERVQLALDASTNRSMDENGFLTVTNCPLTKTQVTQYYGYEIPDWEFNRLVPDKIYNVYRPASELQKPKTIKSFNLIPIQLEHHTEDPERPPTKTRIGSTGESAAWNAPYLTNTLKFFNADAIRRIKDGSMRELSIGYWYKPVFEPGKTPDGKSYDVKMTDIVGNHLALVEVGRAGHDVMVLDSKQPKLSLASEASSNLKRTEHMDEQKDSTQVLNQVLEAMQALTKLISQKQAATTAPAPTGQDSEEGELTDMDDQNAANAPVPEDEPEAGASGEVAPEDDQVTDEDDTSTGDEDSTEDEDEATDEDSTEDEDEACDEDETSAEDEDEACDEDSTEDEDEVSDEDSTEDEENNISPELAEALKASGIDPSDTDAVRGFAKGLEYRMKQEKKATGDSAKGFAKKVKFKRGTAALKLLAHDAKSYLKTSRNTKSLKTSVKSAVQQDIKARFNAANDVKSVLGNVNPLAYDSASQIYREALKKGGLKVTGNMSEAALRSSFRAYRKGCMANDANPRKAIVQTSNSNTEFLQNIDLQLNHRG